jgi:hypothetical protein
MYGLIRIVIAILVASPLILIPVFRHTFGSRRAFFIVSAVSLALVVGVFLYQWPFENQFGGFATAKQAVEYQNGKSAYLYTVEGEESALVLTERSGDVLRKENGRFYLISPRYTARVNAFTADTSVIIRGDQRTQERFVQLTMIETDRNPATITDSKGTDFITAFTFNGLTYFAGEFQEDGLKYTLYIDGMDVGLMKLR